MSHKVIGSAGTIRLVRNASGLYRLDESLGAADKKEAGGVYDLLVDAFPMSTVSYSWQEKRVIGGRVWEIQHNRMTVWVGLDAPYRGDIMWNRTPWLTPVEMGEFAGMLKKALELSEEVTGGGY